MFRVPLDPLPGSTQPRVAESIPLIHAAFWSSHGNCAKWWRSWTRQSVVTEAFRKAQFLCFQLSLPTSCAVKPILRLTLGRSLGGGVSDFFSLDDKHQHLKFFVVGAFWETFGDGQLLWLWRHKQQVVKPFLSENACFLNFFQQVKLLDKMMQSNCLWLCYFTSQAQKIINSHCFYLISNFY